MTMTTVSILKVSVSKWRPNLSNNQSFPSGHTAGAFSGAAFLDMRYGWEFGLPAYALALFTGYSRVQAHKHFADDVISGMSIAILSSAMWTSPFGGRVKVRPIIGDSKDGKSFGVILNVSGGDDERSKQPKNWDFVPSWRFRWEFGVTWEERNLIQAPQGTGTPWNHADFETFNSPVMSALVSIETYLGKQNRHEIIFLFFPYERRDAGSFSRPTNVAGVVFPANTPVSTTYVQYEIRLRWRYELLPKSNWNLKVGAGFSIQDTFIEVVSATQRAKASDTGIIPILHGHVSYDFSRKWNIYLEADGLAIASDEYFFDATAGVMWRFHPQWDLTLAFRFYGSAFDQSDLKNKLQLNRIVIGVAYSW